MIITSINELKELLQKSLYENKVVNGDDVVNDVLTFFEQRNSTELDEMEQEYHCWDYLHGENKL